MSTTSPTYISDRARVRSRLFGRGRVCTRCGWFDPLALVEGSDPLVCYSCQAELAGRPAVEAHHVAGRRSGPRFTRDVPANAHRLLSDWQCDWPAAVRSNPGRLRILTLVAKLLGMADYLALRAAWVEGVDRPAGADRMDEERAADRARAAVYYRCAEALWRAAQTVRERGRSGR